MSQSRMLIRRLGGLSVLIALVVGSTPADASPAPQAEVDGATIDFPNTITFHAEITAPNKITSLILEYGDRQQTCGQVLAEAHPQITPGNSVRADWTWDMRQSGSLPPGSQVWWRWRYTDETGKESVTEDRTITWLDDSHPWQTISKGDIRLHWYKGSADFARQLADAADSGMKRLEEATGLTNDQPIDEYIYASTSDMQDAILYEPSWTGGQAYPEYNIVIMGISPAELDWGLTTEVHELTHVLVGHYSFTCLGGLPTWLQEGLAMYAQGPLDSQFQAPLDQAIHDDSLLPVRSISGPLSAESAKAELSYGQAFSLVKFLLDGYGNQKMNALLIALREGNTVDDGLTSVYGFDIDGLEDAWRASLGAQPRSVGLPTAVPTATMVPTIVPVSRALQAITPTPFTYPTLPPAGSSRRSPPVTLALLLILICCAVGLGVGVIVVLLVVSVRNRRGAKNEKGS